MRAQLALIAMVGVMCSVAAWQPVAAQAMRQSSAPLEFSIPSMALHDALQQYSRLTGRSILYDASQVQGKRSAGLHGSMTADEGLRRLLSDTEMRIAHMSGHLVSLSAALPAAMRASRDARAVDERHRLQYYARLQTMVQQALCTDSALQAGTYRLALRFHIGQGSIIQHLQVHASGQPTLEPAIVRSLSGLPVAVPPDGLAQPVTMLLTPDAAIRSGGCAAWLNQE